MGNIIDGLQSWALGLSGNFIFWAPIVLLFITVLSVWALGSYKGFRVLGWSLGIITGLGAVLTWAVLGDWRADQYAQEFAETSLAEPLVLNGGTVEAEDVTADQYGIVNVNINLEYGIGYSDVLMINDVEDFVNHLVVDYYTAANNNGVNDSYIGDSMRDFQELHIYVNSDQGNYNDILSYHRDTLLTYANEVRISEETDDQVEQDQNIGDSDYRVLRGGEIESPWNMRDEQGSDEGITYGQWAVLEKAPEALNTINEVSCAVLSGFNECSENPQEGEPGPPNNNHSIVMAALLLAFVIVIGSITEVLIRWLAPKIIQRRNDMSHRVVGGPDTEEYVPKRAKRKEPESNISE